MNQAAIRQAVLEDYYINRKMTTREIGKLFNVTKTTIRRWMKIFDIPARTRSESRKEYYKTHNGYWLGKKISKESKEKNRLAHLKEKSWRWNGGSPRYYRSISKSVWEDYWNQKVPKEYVIHHFDGNLENFDITNLPLLTDRYHRRLPHRSKGD